MLAEQCQHNSQYHEYDTGSEHPTRGAAIHDPAEQHRPDRAAYAEPGRDDPERASDGAGRRGGAHQHIAGRHDHPREKAREAHRCDQHWRREADRPDQQHDDGVDREPGGSDIAVPTRQIGDMVTRAVENVALCRCRAQRSSVLKR